MPSITQAQFNANVNSITYDDFTNLQETAKNTKGYIYINKEGHLAVRGFWKNLLGIGGCDNSKELTMNILNAKLKTYVDNADIFRDRTETTIKKGYGLSAGMMEMVSRYKTNMDMNNTQLKSKFAMSEDKPISDKEDGGNNLKLTNKLLNCFVHQINIKPTLRGKTIDEKAEIITEAMKILNDHLDKTDIGKIQGNPKDVPIFSNFNVGVMYKANNEAQGKISSQECTAEVAEAKMQNIKDALELLGIGSTPINPFLQIVKEQYNDGHPEE